MYMYEYNIKSIVEYAPNEFIGCCDKSDKFVIIDRVNQTTKLIKNPSTNTRQIQV
jgi:hypothetical protein